MALGSCPECGKPLSSTAPHCPHCGFVQQQATPYQPPAQQVPVPPAAPPPQPYSAPPPPAAPYYPPTAGRPAHVMPPQPPRSSAGVTVLAIIGGVVVLGAVAGYFGLRNPLSSSSGTDSPAPGSALRPFVPPVLREPVRKHIVSERFVLDEGRMQSYGFTVQGRSIPVEVSVASSSKPVNLYVMSADDYTVYSKAFQQSKGTFTYFPALSSKATLKSTNKANLQAGSYRVAVERGRHSLLFTDKTVVDLKIDAWVTE